MTLPRISFEAAPPPLDESLPRMDVAAFVGFAAAGPLHVPVAVEDSDRFRNVFGEDPVLARHPRDGSPHRAHLGGAVEAFFRNGGKRAWVVRVADEARAVTSEYAVPGLLAPPRDGQGWRIASLRARSPGSWADPLRAAGTLTVAATPARTVTDAEGVVTVVVDPAADVVAGDLLRIDFGGGEQAWMVAAAVVPHLDEGLAVAGSAATGLWWLAPVTDELPKDTEATRLTTGAGEPVTVAVQLDAERLAFDDDEAVAPGDVLTVEDGSVTSFYVLGEQQRAREGEPIDALPHGITASWVVGRPRPSLTGRDAVVEVLRCAALAWRGERREADLGGLGFAAAHPRYLGALPTDAEAFALAAALPRTRGDGGQAQVSDFGRAELSGLASDAMAPRFPFAGPAEPEPVLLPLAMGVTPDPALAGPRPAQADPATALTRDGLDTFSAALFVDEDLARLGTYALLAGAFHKAYVADPPQPLLGMHALLPLTEVTLLAAPDAVHPGWEERVVPAPVPLAAPELHEPNTDGARVSLTWSEVTGASGYEVEVDRDLGFAAMPACHGAAGTGLTLDDWPYCPEIYFFRVRATRDLERGPWSNVVAAHVPAGQFAPSPPGDAEAKLPSAEPAAEQGPELRTWVLAERPPDEPPSDLLAVHTAMLRAAAGRGDVLALLTVPADYRARDAARYVAQLTGSEEAFAAADGAPLARTELAAGVLALDRAEEAALSFGAAYHPWIVTGAAADGEALRHLPPDGPVAGVYAARALARGAWIAPANRPLAGALALDPPVDDADRALLASRAVNTFGRDPRGFAAVGQDTLSVEAALRPVNVRRLMILLRRLVRREGDTYVFRPNDAQFRRLVQMRFERLLADMYRRGAFAGATPDQAYQVATGFSVNLPESVDQGRFVVEIRVAPSRPMQFVTVRLVMTGAGSVEITEA